MYARDARPAPLSEVGMWDNDEHLSVNFGKWRVDVKEEGVAGSQSRTMEWFLKNYKGSDGRLHLTQRMTKRMASQVELPDVFCGVVEHGLRQDVQLSMTSGSHKGPVHCDSEDALLMQFDGSKTVYLADPGYFKALGVKKGSYRRRAFHNVAVSEVDFWRPDERKHPGFAQVRWLQVEVQAGDVLYIPAYWFHAIQSEGERNIVVNHWFAQRPEEREAYDEADLDGEDPNGAEAESECCAECWPCKIRTFCRNTLGANPKFPRCKQTVEMDGVLTPGFKMDEAAGILPTSQDYSNIKAAAGNAGGGNVVNKVVVPEGEDVVRSASDPDLALHSPMAPDWSGGDIGYDGDEDGTGGGGGEEEDTAAAEEELADDAELGEAFDAALNEEEEQKERDYDGSGDGDLVV